MNPSHEVFLVGAKTFFLHWYTAAVQSIVGFLKKRFMSGFIATFDGCTKLFYYHLFLLLFFWAALLLCCYIFICCLCFSTSGFFAVALRHTFLY